MKRPSYLLLLFFVAFTAVSMMVSCHGERSIENERSEEEIMRLKRVGDSVDVLASTSRAMVDSALAASPDSVTYYDYLVELARWSLVQVPDSAMGHINRIMSFARRQERTPRINGLLAEAFHLRANFFFLYHQNQEKALEDNLEAYRLFMVSDMQDNVTSICANIGDVYMQQSLLPEAASWYRRALVLTDSLQLPTSNNSSFFMGLGRIYCLLQDYEKSEEYYHKSLADFDQMHVNMQIYLLNNYGNLKYYKHDYDAALRVFERLDSLIVQ
ncbi:MAG: tetratricopeptide repeat protein, partial [Bacteroidales bacterium]|nr:tetratricopeptide repeat protein [Bacteroidales bacterium]